MKKLILLLLLTITFISCDTQPEPTIRTSNTEFSLPNGDNAEMTTSLLKSYDKISEVGKASYGYISGDTYYFINENNEYYRAVLTSNTNYITISFGGLLITCLIIFLIPIIIYENS